MAIHEINNTRVRKDCESSSSSNLERISIQHGDVLTPEAAAIANPQFEAVQEAAQPMIERIEESWQLTAEDMD